MSWRPVPLADITERITKGTTPTTVGGCFAESGVKFIKAEALNGDSGLDLSGTAFIDSRMHERLRRSILQENDVLVTIAGANVGKCGFVTSEHLPANTNQAVGIVRVDSAKADPRFVYYFFKQKSTFSLCQSVGSQSAQPNVNLRVLGGFMVPLPARDQQRRISSLLLAYDDLVENNLRRMALLEESARLLYREWFVRLRFPEHEHTRVCDGVPEGWRRLALGGCITLNYGKALRSEDRTEGTFPVYGSSGIVGWNHRPLVRAPGVIVGRKGNVGSVFWSSADYWPIDTVYFVSPEASNLYLYYALADMHFISTDVAVPGLNRDFAHSRPLVLPTESVLKAFLAFVEPIRRQIDILGFANEKLRTARDLLLPRVMSGQLLI